MLPEDVLAYMAAVTAHPGYTQMFIIELETPGIRIPITKAPLYGRTRSRSARK